MYYYDKYGWFTSDVIPNRIVEVEPSLTSETVVVGELRANWTGVEWLELPYYQSESADSSLQTLKDSLTAAVTEKRWLCEIAGVTLPSGVKVSTTIEDQNRITSVVTNAELAGVATVDFKSASGWVTLTIQQVKEIAVFIARHVQDCFSAERRHHEAIASAESLEQLQAYDINSGWPE